MRRGVAAPEDTATRTRRRHPATYRLYWTEYKVQSTGYITTIKYRKYCGVDAILTGAQLAAIWFELFAIIVRLSFQLTRPTRLR